MGIQQQKVELARMVLSTDDEQLIKKVRQVFTEAETDLWDELSDRQQEIVKESIAQADAGKLTSHAEVMDRHRKWL